MNVFVEDFRTGETLKRCPKCKQYKKLDEYYKCNNKRLPHGVSSRCKKCLRHADRKYIDRADRFWKFFNSRVIKVGDCLEWNGAYNDDLPICSFRGKRNISLRRIVYELLYGELPANTFVLMSCKNKRCVRQSHMAAAPKIDVEIARINSLPVGDQHQNRIRPERMARGEQANKSLLTENDVRQIRVLYHDENVSQRKLANQFGVTQRAIWQIVNSKTWAHVQ